jgi:Ran GTPase-activating protein 1
VDLSDNAFGLNTVAPLVDFLSEHTPLRYLYLNNNGLGPAAGVLVADALTALAAKKDAARKEGKQVPDLELVICGRNRLENGSMAAWAKAYAANNGVKTIKMTQNGIRQEGITHLLTNGLSHLTKLETFDLQDNTFTAMGANALSKVVGKWTQLRELGVGDCLLSGRGGIALASALEKGQNKQIEILRLAFNDINAKGLAGLASAASTSLPALRRVELNGNKFSEEDASIEKLREVLEARKEESGEHEDDEEYWGLDDLDELDSDDEEEEEESDADEKRGEDSDEEGVEVEEKAARQIVEENRAEDSNVAQDKDKKVDDLADVLAKTEIK